jgi:hypothetical protein
VTACCGTSSAVAFTPSCSTARTYMPGISSLSGLGTTARSVTLPVPASTVTPLKVRRPGCGYLRAVFQHQLDARLGVAGALQPAAGQLALQAQQLAARLRDVHVDRVELLHGGQRRRLVGVTSAPGVTADSSAQPVIGEVMRV